MLRNYEGVICSNIEDILKKVDGSFPDGKKNCLQSRLERQVKKMVFKILDSWRKGVIISLYKEGDQLQCENYRGITNF